VLKATRKRDNTLFAIKASYNAFKTYGVKHQQDFKDEIKLMKELPHPFIVKIIDEFIDSAGF
jgi:serine/threonine protein kinase